MSELVPVERPPPILLYGPHGTGKTSLLRIFARARHCASPRPSPCGQCQSCLVGLDAMKLYEFNAARFNGVDVAKHVEVLMRTTPWGCYGIFLDEVHGLEPKAADVLLAEMERPRPGRFILCATTDLQAVRPALVSRCLLVPLKPIGRATLFGLAQRICLAENISYQPEALDILVGLARGSARDLLMALDGVASRGHLTPALLKGALALDWTEDLVAYADALLARDLEGQLEAIGAW